ncbi:hypothetical protein [Streptomyces blattellae]|uniref:hypothetical protein n=1 Tax=Streptomyces blattellae TaxID=2569855 RepID=UPI0012B91770|nr:hypothetical protein [Streptomyces blattellae]
MISGMDHFPTTEAAVTALREIAAEHAREIEVSHDIGADQTSRRTAAGIGATTDPDGSLPHEAYVEFGGSPRVSVRLYPEDDALITVEGVECPDIPRDDVPAFLRSVFGGLAYVTARRFPPGYRLVVPLPGDRVHKEWTKMIILTPWLSSRVR